MVYYELAYIKRYKKQSKYKNKDNKIIKREIETVQTKGLKKTSKFKDNQEIVIIDKKEFQEMEQQLKELHETNNKLLTNDLNQMQTNNNKMEFKLIELMEIVNNRNELLFNANEQFNNIIDAIIKELSQEYNNLMLDVNKKNKKALELYLNDLLNNSNKELINNINLELDNINNEFNNIGFLELFRKRKKINIKLECLEQLPENNNIVVSGGSIENIFNTPNFFNIDVSRIKANAKNNIDFSKLYINFSNENNLIDL